jgi:hypothetical protein
VKPVAVAISKTVWAAEVCAKTMLLDPNVIALVFALFELKIPVVKSKPFKLNVPLVNVVVPVATNESAEPNEVVPDVLAIVNAAIVLVLLIIVPVPTMLAVNVVKVPPELKVNEFKFIVADTKVNAVVPKSSLLNQLLPVNVITAVPEPVKVQLGAFVDVPPPVAPKFIVLATAASVDQPPVPV